MYFFVELFEDYANNRSAQEMETLQLSIERLMDAISRFGNYNQEVIKELCLKPTSTLTFLSFCLELAETVLYIPAITQRTACR